MDFTRPPQLEPTKKLGYGVVPTPVLEPPTEVEETIEEFLVDEETKAKVEYHSTLPPTEQVDFRVAEARAGNWQVPTVIALDRYKQLSNFVGTVAAQYEEKPEWLRTLLTDVATGEKRLSEYARKIASDLPKWVKVLGQEIIKEFGHVDLKHLRKVKSAIAALRAAVALALVEQSIKYFNHTIRNYHFKETEDFFREVLPQLELHSIQDKALSGLTDLMGESRVVRIVVNVVGRILDDFRRRHQDLRVVVSDYVQVYEQSAYNEMAASSYTAQISNILRLLDEVLTALEDVNQIQNSIEVGLSERGTDPIAKPKPSMYDKLRDEEKSVNDFLVEAGQPTTFGIENKIDETITPPNTSS